MNGEAITIGMVCEGSADFQTASSLADRILCEHERLVTWLTSDLLQHVRSYVGQDESQSWFTWSEMKGLARRLNIDFQGHFDQRPHAPDAVMAVRAIRVIRRLINADAVILIRDDDGVAVRKLGFEQARVQEELRHAPLAIIVGIAHTKRECWVLAGFEPRDDAETELLRIERQTVGFDPREQAHRLTAKHDPANDKLSAKRVLWTLTGKCHQRESACWEETDLQVLRRRVANSGLSDFLMEVEERLIPLLSSRR